jgi:glucan phosphoethanolaminetransferase (alkaline phosphatase superfamily)
MYTHNAYRHHFNFRGSRSSRASSVAIGVQIYIFIVLSIIFYFILNINQTEPAIFLILPCWAFFSDFCFLYFIIINKVDLFYMQSTIQKWIHITCKWNMSVIPPLAAAFNVLIIFLWSIQVQKWKQSQTRFPKLGREYYVI